MTPLETAVLIHGDAVMALRAAKEVQTHNPRSEQADEAVRRLTSLHDRAEELVAELRK